MQKLYSELIGMQVFDENSPSPVAIVKDVLVDTETGKVIGFMVKNRHIIVPMDIQRIGREIYIGDQDHVVPLDDILRAKNVSNMKIPIIGAKVFTERQKFFLGRVVDYEISLPDMLLHSIHVAKSFLFFRFQEKIIHRNSIIIFNKHSIIVKDAVQSVRAMEKSAVTTPAVAA